MDKYCEYCEEEFSPIEGNDFREFCSSACEQAYLMITEDDENEVAYYEGYGRSTQQWIS
jgi:endogenous inhibitor of DNA gyrase (YacG/DUF329 family)